jgi:hypothetical protein
VEQLAAIKATIGIRYLTVLTPLVELLTCIVHPQRQSKASLPAELNECDACPRVALLVPHATHHTLHTAYHANVVEAVDFHFQTYLGVTAIAHDCYLLVTAVDILLYFGNHLYCPSYKNKAACR